MKIVDPKSLLSVPLAIKSHNGMQIGSATGFFWRRPGGRTFLVSNYHVFSGNHYQSDQSVFKHSGFPATMDYPRFVNPRMPTERSVHCVRLCNEAGNDRSWIEHPVHVQYKVDVGVVEIPTVADDQSYVHAVNDQTEYECERLLHRYPPGFELLVIGFFLKDRPTGYFPTYIRGFVASEMDALYHGKRAFLIDAQTSSGMSGSPVFSTGLEQVEPGKKWSRFKTTPPFLGIYSGRITEPEGEAIRELQVGLVWSRELIQQTIDAIP